MKHFAIALWILILALALNGCGEQGQVSVFDRYGNEYTIDREQGTISDGTYTYGYTYDGNSERFSISIDYPNGARYTYNQSGGFGTGSQSSNYDDNTYARGDVLADVLRDNTSKKGGTKNIFAGILLMGLGTFHMACPQAGWYLSYGWRYKNAEPSNAALVFGRISGTVILIIGVITMLC